MNFLKRLLLPALLFAVAASGSPSAKAATETARVAWHRDMAQAAALARKTGKPMLIQFTADWCGYCHKMLRETYTDDAVIRQINECFIPVLVDADAHERLVDAIGVSAFPTTVILSPQLDVRARIEGFHRPVALTRRLAAFCRQPATSSTQITKLTPPKTTGLPITQPIRPATARLETAPTPGTAAAGDTATADAATPTDTSAAAEVTATGVPAESGDSAIPAAKPQIAFDGLCLVSLLNDRQFRAGDRNITHQYKGVTLQFVSEASRREFLGDPEKYWPLADGRCPVATVNAEKDTAGDVRTVAVFRGRLTIFHSLAHRNEFATRPGEYLQRLETVLRAAR